MAAAAPAGRLVTLVGESFDDAVGGKFVSGTVTLSNYDLSADAGSFLMEQAEAVPAVILVTLRL